LGKLQLFPLVDTREPRFLFGRVGMRNGSVVVLWNFPEALVLGGMTLLEESGSSVDNFSARLDEKTISILVIKQSMSMRL